MKIFILVIFNILNFIISDIQGITINSLKESYKDVLPLINIFHKFAILIDNNEQKTYMTLFKFLFNENNINFKIEDKIVHIIFQNIKILLKGQVGVTQSGFKQATHIEAKMDTLKYELLYSVDTRKLETGQYKLEHSFISESELSLNIDKISSKFDGMPDVESQIKKQILSFEYTPYKDFLKKIPNLIFESLQFKLNKNNQ